MTITLNWSERGERPMRDCTYAAGLTGMVFGGYTAFPKGIYTHEEREALERSDNQPNETGAAIQDLTLAIRRRYGKTLDAHSIAQTRAKVAAQARGLAVQGHLSNFPRGHRLRRWQPSFAGGHAVFIRPLGGGKWQWYDPLAPMRFAGDTVSSAEVLLFIKTIGTSTSFMADAWAPPAVVTPPTPPQPPVVEKTRTEVEYQAVVAQRDQAVIQATTARDALAQATVKISAAKAALE